MANCVCKFYDLVSPHAGLPFSSQICHTDETDRPDYTTPPGSTARGIHSALDIVIAFWKGRGIFVDGASSSFLFLRSSPLLKRG